MSPIVIVGSGLAGYSLARELRKLDKQTPLLIISHDDGSAYSKPMLSNALSKGKTAQDLVTADAAKMALQLDAEIRPFARVTAIDSEAHTLTVNDEVLSYSKLVLAVGADPFRPNIEGDDGSILSLNDLADYQRFRQQIEGKERLAIIGGGLIGCEFANDLSQAGFQVSVIDRQPQPLSHLLPEMIGRELNLALQRCGVEWHSQDEVSGIRRHDDGFELLLQSGVKVAADVVLSAIGLQPRIQLAAKAGLVVNRGIVVDSCLQTSSKDIYALGDCAEVKGAVLPFVMPLMIGARALAKTLVDTKTAVEYPPMPVALKTPAYPVSVLPPAPGLEAEWQIEKTADAIKALYIDGNERVRGFALSGAAVKQAAALARSMTNALVCS